MGNFKGQIREDLVPITGNNFIDLTNSGFYDDLIFHRVIQGFVIQDGDPGVLSCALNDSTLTLTAGNITEGSSTVSLKGTSGDSSETFGINVSVIDYNLRVENLETGDLTRFPWQTAAYGWSVTGTDPAEGVCCLLLYLHH